jgi:uncharacterized membrane protein
MTPGIELALASMLLFGVGDFVYKRGAAAGVPAHHFLMVQSCFFTPLVILYGVFTGELAFGAASLWGAIAGFFILIGFYNFAFSLRSGAVSVNAPIFRLSFAITAALAMWLLAEPLTAPKLLGLALALVAAWLLLATSVEGDAVSGREKNASLVRVLVAAGAVGVGNFIYKLGLRDGATPVALIAAQGITVVTLATVFAGIVDRRVRPVAATWRYAPVAALVLAGAFMCLVESLARGQASLLVPVAQMGFVVSAVLGFLFLSEPFTLRKGAGLAAALAALASLASG